MVILDQFSSLISETAEESNGGSNPGGRGVGRTHDVVREA